MKAKKSLTLIEYTVILMIIGLMYVVIMQGRSAITSANAARITKTFMTPWVSVAGRYHEIQGYNIYGTEKIRQMNSSQTDAPVSAPRRCYEFEIVKEMAKAGIDIKGYIESSNSVCTTFIEGKTIGKPVVVAFGAMKIAGNGYDRVRNVLIFNNVPVDMAKRFDKMMDGSTDGTKGNVISDGLSTSHGLSLDKISGNTPTKPWTPKEWSEEDGHVAAVYVVLEH